MQRSLLLCMLLLPLFSAWFGAGAQAQAPSPSSTCTVDYSEINFGDTIDILPNASIPGAGSVFIQCYGLSQGQSARICLGMNRAGSDPQMINQDDNASPLYYDIFTDDQHTRPWFSQQKKRPFADVTFVAPIASVPFYGLIRSGQSTSPVGQYVDFVRPPFRYFTYDNALAPPDCDTAGYDRPPVVLAVRARITANCTISVTDMTFPSQTIFTADVLQQSALTVTCTNNAPYWVSLDNGQNALSGQRRMRSGANYIDYELYRESARASRWGATKDVDTVAGKGSATGQVIPVYGKIPKPTISPAPGKYVDQIIATVNF